MNRQKFLLNMSTLTLGGTILQLSTAFKTPDTGLTNWAGNLRYSAKKVVYPKTVAELKTAILSLKGGKALGSQHSFNKVADTTETLISSAKLDKVLSIDTKNLLVWCEGGIKYGMLGLYLEKRGYALHNLASLPHISVAGACATATHGSGIKNGNLSSAVRAIELMKADGSTVVWDEKNPEFYGAVVNIGALGIVTRMALAIQPTYQVTQEVYENLPMNALEKHFDDIYSAGYSVSMFTHWLDRTINQVWVKKKVGEQYPTTHFHGATPAKTNLHPIKVNSPVNCTDQMGVPGPWYERLPHFKMGFTPSNGAELQTEFFIPRKYAYQAIMAVESLHEVISPVLFVTEIRSIAADAFWLSPAYKQDVIAIHFTWKQEVDKVMQVIPQVEAKLKPFGAMPHWGKIFTMPATELQSRYPKFKDFRALAKKMDPKGVWKNEFLERNLYT